MLTLNVEHLGIGRLGFAGLYTATAELASMLQDAGVQVSEVWWNEPSSSSSVVAPVITPAEAIRAVAEGEVVAIYTQYLQTGLVFEVAAHAWPRAVPIISISHDLTAAMDPLRSWWSSPARHPADAIVMSSRAGARALRSMVAEVRADGPNPAPPDPEIVVLPLGTSLPAGVPERAIARTRRHWPDDDPVFLWLGRFSLRYKADLRPLLLAFREVLARVPSARLVAVGSDDGATAAELHRLAAHLGIAERCEWHTDAPPNIRNECLGGADVLVNVSDHVQETFGLSILEAMACGLPVIAADWSGFRDLVGHGASGLLVPTRLDTTWLAAPDSELYGSLSAATYVELEDLVSAMAALAREPTVRRRMGDRARARVESELSWRALAPRYVDLIDRRRAVAAELPPRSSPRRWMSSAFAGFPTATLDGSLVVVPGRTALGDIIDLVDDRLRQSAAELVTEVQRGHLPTSHGSPSGRGLSRERAALMALLKLDVLRVAGPEQER